MKNTLFSSRLAIVICGLLVHQNFVMADPNQNEFSELPPKFDGGYTTETYKAALKSAGEVANRKIANTENTDEATALSEHARNIRNSLIGGSIYVDGNKKNTAKGAKTGDEINSLLVQLEEDFKADKFKETDAKFLAATLLMMRPYRGFIHRARNIFDTNEGNATLARANAVTALRFAASGISVYLPTPQWEAGFAYSVEPTYSEESAECKGGKWSENCDIHNGPAFQSWLHLELLPRLNTLHKVLRESSFREPIYWDNQILYGQANFTSTKDRLIRLGEAERYLMLSATQAAISGVYGNIAYSMDGLFESFDEVAKIYGFQAQFSSDIALPSARFNAIRKSKNLFKFKKDGKFVARHLTASYNALKASLQNSHLAWVTLNNGGAVGQDTLIDPRLVAPFNRLINTGFQNTFGIVGIQPSGQEVGQGDVLSAVVNGEKVTVKLKEFFDNPPDSLQDFMPTGFLESGTEKWLTKTVGNEKVKYRNYEYGRPNRWNLRVYKKYFEGIRSDKDVEKTARVLSQSWGAFPLAAPLALMML